MTLLSHRTRARFLWRRKTKEHRNKAKGAHVAPETLSYPSCPSAWFHTPKSTRLKAKNTLRLRFHTGEVPLFSPQAIDVAVQQPTSKSGPRCPPRPWYSHRSAPLSSSRHCRYRRRLTRHSTRKRDPRSLVPHFLVHAFHVKPFSLLQFSKRKRIIKSERTVKNANHLWRFSNKSAVRLKRNPPHISPTKNTMQRHYV